MALGARASGADRLLAGWTALVALLLLAPPDLIRVPGLDVVESPRGLDKSGHFLLFVVLAALAARAARPRTRHPLLLAAAASFLYGALLELLQGLFGVRLPEVGDLVADGLGSCAGVLLPAFFWRRS